MFNTTFYYIHHITSHHIIFAVLSTSYVSESEECLKDCGANGTCLKDPLLFYDPPVCRCDKGYLNDKEGKCVGRLYFLLKIQLSLFSGIPYMVNKVPCLLISHPFKTNILGYTI